MASVAFPADLQRHTGGRAEVAIDATRYRDAVVELCERFPALTEEVLSAYAVAIDGLIIHEPLLECFDSDSELVFVPQIAGG